MNESKKSLQKIFNEALEIQEPIRRAEYLGAACGTDEGLREKIEGLIEAKQGAGRVAEESETVVGASGYNQQPGDRIGRYKLLQQVGEGGCGVVYMAEQEQ